MPYTHRAIHPYSLSYRKYSLSYSLSYRKYSGWYPWFKNSIVTSICHVYLKTIEGYRMLQSMYIYTSWEVLSVWYYIIDYVHNVVVKTLQSALFPQGIGSGKSSLCQTYRAFTTVVVLTLKPLWVTAIRNSNWGVPQLVLALA